MVEEAGALGALHLGIDLEIARIDVASEKRAERARFLDHIGRREYDWYL